MANEVGKAEQTALPVLSDDINVITTEIRSYQQIGGQAIFEIGRRLKWVKEHDLAHGQFGGWLDSIQMGHRQAQQFMKIATEIPESNAKTSSHLGVEALYQIATMPVEDKEAPVTMPNGDQKKLADMTVKELRETKAALKREQADRADTENKLAAVTAESADLRQQLKDLQDEEKPTAVIEKKVVPDDYDELKQDHSEMQARIDELEAEVEDRGRQAQELAKQRDRYARTSEEYKNLEDQIAEKKKQRTNLQTEISQFKTLSDFVDVLGKVVDNAAAVAPRLQLTEIPVDSPLIVHLNGLSANLEAFLDYLNEELRGADLLDDLRVAKGTAIEALLQKPTDQATAK